MCMHLGNSASSEVHNGHPASDISVNRITSHIDALFSRVYLGCLGIQVAVPYLFCLIALPHGIACIHCATITGISASC